MHYYYSYLIFLYTKHIDDHIEIKDISTEKLAEHFMNAIKCDKTSKYAKLLRKNAEKNSQWNLLLNKIKFLYFAANDLNLSNLIDVEMGSD